MKKRSLSLLLALVMVFSLLPMFNMNAAATSATGSLDNMVSNKLKITWTSDDGNDSSGKVTRTNDTAMTAVLAKKSCTTTLTLTNISDEPQNLSFTFSATANKGTVVIDGYNVVNNSSVSNAKYPDDHASNWSGTLAANTGAITITMTRNSDSAGGSGNYTNLTLTNIQMEDATPTDIQEGEIYSSGFVYTPKKDGLLVGDDIDLSQTYYVQVDGQWKEVTISKDTYYTAVANDGADHNDRVVKTQKSDGYYGEPSAVTGWTPITGEGMYYMKDHNTFLPVQAENGTLTHDAYSNKLIAAKSSSPSDGMIVGPGESIGGWNSGESDVIVVDAAGNEHTVLYANKGSTFHYNMFIYYKDGNDVVYLTQGANEDDGDSKYNYEREGVGKYYYTYNNTLGSYGGKGYYTGTYYRANSHSGKVALYYVDGGTTYWLSRSGVTTDASARTNAIHDHMVVYTGPLYQLQTLQRATYFSYEGGTPVESRLGGDELTSLTLYTRRMSGESEITQDDPDNGTGADQMGTLVDVTNNFKGNLFIQKSLYRANDGTYNIKLESWATGDMSSSGGGQTDIVIVVDRSWSMCLQVGSSWYDGIPKRYDYLADALRAFVGSDGLPKTKTNGVSDYRVAIVSYGGKDNNGNIRPDPRTGIYNGASFTDYSTTLADSVYSSAWKDADSADLTATVNALDQKSAYDGGTAADTFAHYGMDLAYQLLSHRSNSEGRATAVILFTDGTPGVGDKGYYSEASNTVDEAYKIKRDFPDTKIYTVSLMPSTIPDTTEVGAMTDAQKGYTFGQYMNGVSSNYPSLQNFADVKTTTPSANNYYSRVEVDTEASASQLVDIFKDIATSIATTDVPVTTSSILRDTINQNDFALPKYVAGQTVTVSTVPAAAINSRKQIQWDYENETKSPTGVLITPSLETNMDGAYLKDVNVSGYNYQENFSAPNLANLSESTLGNKLVVRIYGLKPKHGGEVYSNSEAGILNQPEGSSSFEMYLPVESPFDDIATRSYVVDFNARMDLATNATLVDEDYSGTTKYANTYMTDGISGTNGNFANTSGTVSYQLIARDQVNGSTNFKNYSFTGSDTALVFGQYYANDTRADGTKTPGDITTKQIVEGEKVDQTVAQAWQVVNMIPASSIYYDDDLAGTTAVVGDGSGYNAAVTVSPAQTAETTKKTLTFTGTGIDIYCTTDKTGGYAQAKLDGDKEQTQTMRNYSETPRYNVPTFSFRGLEYGMHVVEINVLSTSNYRFDGVRVYGPEENQAVYEDTSEQYAAYINMREAMVNDNGVDQTFTDPEMTNPVLGLLFVDDSSKMKLEQEAQYWDPTLNNGEGGYVVDTDKDGNPVKVTVYEDVFAAYKENSPKNEIYLAPAGTTIERYVKDESGNQVKTESTVEGGQAIVFTLNGDLADQVRAGSVHLWIGLSAPDASANGGKVTIGTEFAVSNAVDQYYPITAEMLGDSNVVTIKNTGSTMISVTNLKITGSEAIYTAANAPKTNTNGAGAESVEDAIMLVFEPVTMKMVKIAANNGVDPDAVVTDDPGTTEEPGTPDEPDDPKPGWDDSAFNPMNLLKNLFKLLLQSLGNLFSGLGGW